MEFVTNAAGEELVYRSPYYQAVALFREAQTLDAENGIDRTSRVDIDKATKDLRKEAYRRLREACEGIAEDARFDRGE